LRTPALQFYLVTCRDYVPEKFESTLFYDPQIVKNSVMPRPKITIISYLRYIIMSNTTLTYLSIGNARGGKKITFKAAIKKSILIDNMISEMSKQIRFQQVPGNCLNIQQGCVIFYVAKINVLAILHFYSS